ncbi:restriction endonuclease subunit S [Bradyrhizobium yuanmingense]|uniref:restriction endonuclease subunit S n=1 Tax=Bradyrhizobium yuanmingense TaxID=108015 RepID=UPI001CD7D48D
MELGQVCQLDRRTISAAEAARDGLDFVSMEHVDPNTGKIVVAKGSRTGDGKGLAFLFDSRHVLFGKLRPYLRKIALPQGNGCSSTELVPLLPDPRQLDRAYLFHWVRRAHVIDTLMAKATGARMPRADMSVLLSMSIPLPPLDEQQRIVALLDRAAEIRHRADVARIKSRAIIPALFLDTFGDPAANPKGWPSVTVGDLLCGATYGTSRKANDGNVGIPVIRMGNVTIGGELDTSELKHIEISGVERENAEIVEGDLLFNRTNSKELVGKTGLWDGRFEAVAASYFIRLRVKRDICNPAYLWAFFNTQFMKRVLFQAARGAIGQANINAKELKAFRVAIPPLDLQMNFAERVQRIKTTARLLDAVADKAEAVAGALAAKLFDPMPNASPFEQRVAAE